MRYFFCKRCDLFYKTDRAANHPADHHKNEKMGTISDWFWEVWEPPLHGAYTPYDPDVDGGTK